MRVLRVFTAFLAAFIVLSVEASAQVPDELAGLKGKSGIIGEVDLRFPKDDKYSTITPSVANVAVFSRDKKRVSRGVGTLVEYSYDQCAIVTAKHVVIDSKTGEFKGVALFFGSTVDAYEDILIRLEPSAILSPPLLNPLADRPFDDDILLLSVGCNGRPSLREEFINRSYGDFLSSQTTKIELLFISTWAPKKTDDISIYTHVYQNDLQLNILPRTSGPRLIADADVLSGFSGSPFFVEHNGNYFLIGVLSKKRAIGACLDFDHLRCHSIIAPLY